MEGLANYSETTETRGSVRVEEEQVDGRLEGLVCCR